MCLIRFSGPPTKFMYVVKVVFMFSIMAVYMFIPSGGPHTGCQI